MPPQQPSPSPLDALLGAADRALRSVLARPVAQRAYPAAVAPDEAAELTDEQRREAAALMRVNHVGEVCAQALYEAQALGTTDARLRAMFVAAAREEVDHLAWTRRRLDELGGRPSLLNSVWYAGAFALGLVAARLGDRASLGFMAETERQVEQHLQGHLERLPPADTASRALVERMQADEAAHAQAATELGGIELPWLARQAMRLAARVMTRTAHRI